MSNVLYLIIGLIAGGLLGWLLASFWARMAAARELADLKSKLAGNDSTVTQLREQLAQQDNTVTTLRDQLDTERRTRVAVETRLEETSKQFEQQRKTLQEAETKLKESFESLSAKALQANAEQFLTSAKKTLETVLAEAKGDIGKRQEAINTLVKPLAESLKRYEEQIRLLEQNRQKAYGSLTEQMKTLTDTSQQLQKETGRLVTSLRNPKVRGQWGELALRRAAELAGMVEHCDFEEQVHIADDDEGRFRPDMVVHLPGQRTVVVDAKAVLDAYLDAVAATDETQRQECLKRHADQIRSRIKELSAKSYWDKLATAPEFVVLFLPGESFFSAAVEIDRTLIEDAIASRVVLASPTTLIALLRAIAYGWRQEQIAQNAEQISQLGRELFDRMRTLTEHLSRIGAGLDRAVDSYNKAAASLESRILPSARKFKELGAATGQDINELSSIEQTSRRLDTSKIDET
ncbi:MAG: DNA recombination protein RmuC [Planctomycetota bacterium]